MEPPKIDLKPLTDTLESHFKDDTIDLNNYRAQDIKDDGDTQYIGFTNVKGEWYIVENKTRKNQLRYKFGKSGYAKAWREAETYTYTLLYEAASAL